MHPKKILLVEDSPLLQHIVKMILEQLHCHVDMASTGEEAVILFMKNNYNFVFMDIGLPSMDGIMAARLIREQERGNNKQSTPIIALTAHDDKAMKAEALAAGMNDYLIKPLSLQRAQTILKIYFHKINTRPLKK